MKIVRTDSSHKDFQKLCSELDKELNDRYGKSQALYDRYNIVEKNNTVIIGYLKETPVASGCIKKIDKESVEIKRMYVVFPVRRKGLSSKILSELEQWAKELGHSMAMLETGKGQPEAIGLYKKAGYEIIDNYGPYVGRENSVCMKKNM